MKTSDEFITYLIPQFHKVFLLIFGGFLPLCGAGVRARLDSAQPVWRYAALQKPVLTEDSQVSGEETVLESTPVLCFDEFFQKNICKVIYINKQNKIRLVWLTKVLPVF